MVDVEAGYRGPQVCKIVCITYRQLDYWARTDLVRPSVCDANGSGTQRLYSWSDLIELKVVKKLLDAGVSLQRARKAIEYLRDNIGENVAAANLILDGSRSVLAHTGDQIVDLLRDGQGVLNIVPLAPVVQELQSGIHELGPAPAAIAPAAATAVGE
jgi:DNA-binding transcriptional MerR regulator